MIKQLAILITFLVLSFDGVAQSNNTSNFASDITRTIKLPTRKEVGKKKLLGKYRFTVDVDGRLKDITVKDSMGYGIDEDIIKKLYEAKNWKVAEINGEKRAISYTLPILLTLPKK
ncbi:hypothetical protein SF1_38850 [Sphingobacterium faecium NBRC 15299]|uniref:energy transducer TonB n=1 Tax=Sphingobacterium faecium TaxID=34087 RepID=UPI000D3B4E49|nr:hypothetical protein [Sphingobacterium faecium]PTX07550.1 hypothetical protein C8N37_11159 [Sphingobacterium faecium]GEM65903.1 hypothetical protein SF1_38850 [Sphingobacterium faecium NBRC 15299]